MKTNDKNSNSQQFKKKGKLILLFFAHRVLVRFDSDAFCASGLVAVGGGVRKAGFKGGGRVDVFFKVFVR